MRVSTIETTTDSVNVSAIEELHPTRKGAQSLRFSGMPPNKKTGPATPVVGRYPQRMVRAAIETARERLGINVKQAAAHLGVIRGVWYKKRDNDGSSFTLEDISLLAEVWNAPDLWPFRSLTNEEWTSWRDRWRRSHPQ